MLRVEDLASGYGEAVVLDGVSFRAREGEVTCILGPNGVGKTTLLRTVMGLVPARRGRVFLRGEPIHGEKTHAIVRRGMIMIPEGRRLWPSLSVRENLEMGAYAAPRERVRERLEEVLRLFPHLATRQDRSCANLSVYRQFYDEPRFRPQPLTRQMLAAGLLGRKTGRGFYSYADGAAVRTPEPQAPASRPEAVWVSRARPELLERTVRLVRQLGGAIDERDTPGGKSLCVVTPVGEDATTAAARERLDPTRTVAVESLIAQQRIAAPDDVDRAVVLGLGYPHGPLAWGDRLGPRVVLEILENLHALSGDPRYRPSPWLRRRALLGVSLLVRED